MKNWDSLMAFFQAIADEDYVVLRNYESFDSALLMQEHPDIDLLCGDRGAVSAKLQSSSRVKNPDDPIHRKVLIAHTEVSLDLRCVGDGYYDAKWEEALIKRRVLWHDLCFVPNAEDYFYSLLYHALIQKRSLSEDYQNRLQTMGASLLPAERNPVSLRVLENYMRENRYFYTYPESPGTIFQIKDSDPALIRRDPRRKLKRAVAALKQHFK